MRRGHLIGRLAAVVVGAMALVATLAGSALAYTSSPPATTVVEGNGGGTAFTGGNVSTAAIVAVALFVIGLGALFMARRRSTSHA